MNKKIIIGLALLTAPILLTGCGSKKTLTCVSQQSSSGPTENTTATLVYEGKTMKSGEVVYTFDFSNIITDDSQYEVLKQQKYCDSMVPQLKLTNKSMADGIGECTEKWDNKTLNITINLDAEALSKKDNFKGIDNAKKEFETGNAMKCEIK